MDWNRWESSFDTMFWMTPEERNEIVQELDDRVREEKDAAEVLFNMFQGDSNNAVTASVAAPVAGPGPVASLVGVTFPSAANTPLVTAANNPSVSVPTLDEVQVDSEQNMTDAVNDYMHKDNCKLYEHDLQPLRDKDKVHEIPDQEPAPAPAPAATVAQRNKNDTDNGNLLLLAKTTRDASILSRKGYDVIPDITKDNEERERKEKERVDKLNKNNKNTILNYTTVHQGGIAGTEKKKSSRKQSNAQNQINNKSKKKGSKANAGSKKTDMKNGKAKKVKNVPSPKNTNTETGKRKSKNSTVEKGKRRVG